MDTKARDAPLSSRPSLRSGAAKVSRAATLLLCLGFWVVCLLTRGTGTGWALQGSLPDRVASSSPVETLGLLSLNETKYQGAETKPGRGRKGVGLGIEVDNEEEDEDVEARRVDRTYGSGEEGVVGGVAVGLRGVAEGEAQSRSSTQGSFSVGPGAARAWPVEGKKEESGRRVVQEEGLEGLVEGNQVGVRRVAEEADGESEDQLGVEDAVELDAGAWEEATKAADLQGRSFGTHWLAMYKEYLDKEQKTKRLHFKVAKKWVWDSTAVGAVDQVQQHRTKAVVVKQLRKREHPRRKGEGQKRQKTQSKQVEEEVSPWTALAQLAEASGIRTLPSYTSSALPSDLSRSDAHHAGDGDSRPQDSAQSSDELRAALGVRGKGKVTVAQLRKYKEAALARHAAQGVRVKAAAQAGGQQGTSETPWCGYGRRWDSSTADAQFVTYGCTSISGIHTGITHLGTVVLIDRSDSNNTFLKLPGTNQNAYGAELTFNDSDPVYPFRERPLNVKSNVFCSSGQMLPDGSLLSIGGSSDSTNADPLLNGSFSLRLFKPCLDASCDFELVDTMTTKRWYPTAQIMPSGRVLIVGGANVYGNIAINTITKNNPTVEYYPRRKGEGNYYLQFLVDTVPFNLYAFVHVLPSGLVFIFANSMYTLFDSTTNQEVPGNYPQLNVTNPDGIPVSRSYPVSGTSVLFPLSSANNYTAEIMICGGNLVTATYVNGNRPLSFQNAKIPADPYCWRIQPEAPNATWTQETMCNWPKCDTLYRRVMGDAVLLPDNSLLIINGGTTGYQGLDQKFSIAAQTQPLIYFPQNYSWFPPSRLPVSLVARMYHSSALILPDASVLVTGSNPNPFLTLSGGFPTQFRVEKFIPPYLMSGVDRPMLLKWPRSITVNSLFGIYFNSTQRSTKKLTERFSVTLMDPGFSTHNQRHGMRNIQLDITAATRVTGNVFLIICKAPITLNLAPPTMYWLHVLDNGIPNVVGVSVNFTRSLQRPSSPPAPTRKRRVSTKARSK